MRQLSAKPTSHTLGETSEVVPNFNLIHEFPIQTKTYKSPQNVQKFAKIVIKHLKEAGIIENADSNYAFPVIFVKKKSNSKTNNSEHIKYCMAIDYRLLNEILESDPYPIPDIKAILHDIARKKLYYVLDLHSAFFQIKLNPEDKHRLAFVTEFGHFTMNRIPFDTKISTYVFAKLMDKVIHEFCKNF